MHWVYLIVSVLLVLMLPAIAAALVEWRLAARLDRLDAAVDHLEGTVRQATANQAQMYSQQLAAAGHTTMGVVQSSDNIARPVRGSMVHTSGNIVPVPQDQKEPNAPRKPRKAKV